MKIIKIVFHHMDGSIHTINDKADIFSVVKSLPSKLNWQHTANVTTLHDKYFAMLTSLAKNANTGYTKTELHNALRPIILGQFKDFPNYFTDGKFTTETTRTLNYYGWMAAIEQLKSTANDIFNYTCV